MIALTVSQYNGFLNVWKQLYGRVEALLQTHSCFFSHSMKQRVLGGHAPRKFLE